MRRGETDPALRETIPSPIPPLQNLERGPGSEVKVPLRIELTLTGDLTPTLTQDGRAIDLTTEGGVRVLRYGGLYAEDAVGRRLPAYLAISSSLISVLVDDSSAVYPIVVDPLLSSPSWTARAARPKPSSASRWVPRGM